MSLNDVQYWQVCPRTKGLVHSPSIAPHLIIAAQMGVQKKQKVSRIPWFKQDVSGILSWRVICFPAGLRKITRRGRTLQRQRRIFAVAKVTKLQWVELSSSSSISKHGPRNLEDFNTRQTQVTSSVPFQWELWVLAECRPIICKQSYTCPIHWYASAALHHWNGAIAS